MNGSTHQFAGAIAALAITQIDSDDNCTALHHPAALISPALFVLSVTYLQILPEERTLEEKFGHSFKAYCKGTRRWF